MQEGGRVRAEQKVPSGQPLSDSHLGGGLHWQCAQPEAYWGSSALGHSRQARQHGRQVPRVAVAALAVALVAQYLLPPGVGEQSLCFVHARPVSWTSRLLIVGTWASALLTANVRTR